MPKKTKKSKKAKKKSIKQKAKETSRKKPTAERKAEAKKKKAKSAYQKARSAFLTAKKTLADFEADLKLNKHDKKGRAMWSYMVKKEKKVLKAKKNRYIRLSPKYKRARAKAERVKKNHEEQARLNNLASKIKQHNSKWRNEGKAAIYPTELGHGNSIVYFSPYSSENETVTSNATTYPIDKGAPRSDYIRESGDQVTIDGLIAGKTRSEAKAKYEKLRNWQDNHVTLTYKGDIYSFYSKHLQITSLQQSYQSFRDNILCSITFDFIYAARITKSTGKSSKKKKSKSSKTVQGNRSKRYVAITVKKGDTLWGLSKKYGKSVAWLQKVNHIKNVDHISVGENLYVKTKPRQVKVEKYIGSTNSRKMIRTR